MTQVRKIVTALVIIAVALASVVVIMNHMAAQQKPITHVGHGYTSTLNASSYLSSPNFMLIAYNGSSITINNYGANVTVPIPAKRIIADNTVAHQILIDIGAKDYVVGIEGYAAKLPFLFGNLTALPAVSRGMWTWNYELMTALRPDVVVEWSYGVSTVRQKLQPFGIPVIAYGPFDNLTAFIYYLGLITNRTGEALRLIGFINNVSGLLSTHLSQINHKYRAYVIFDYEYSLWFTAGNNSDPYWAVVRAGLKPCFNKSMRVEPSAVLSCNPDVIVVVTWYLNPHWPNATEYCSSIINSIRSNPVLNATNAVKNNEIIVIPGYLTEGPPRDIVALYIAKHVYPQAFAGVNPEYYLDYYFTHFLTTAEPGGTWWCAGS